MFLIPNKCELPVCFDWLFFFFFLLLFILWIDSSLFPVLLLFFLAWRWSFVNQRTVRSLCVYENWMNELYVESTLWMNCTHTSRWWNYWEDENSKRRMRSVYCTIVIYNCNVQSYRRIVKNMRKMRISLC